MSLAVLTKHTVHTAMLCNLGFGCMCYCITFAESTSWGTGGACPVEADAMSWKDAGSLFLSGKERTPCLANTRPTTAWRKGELQQTQE